MSEIPRRKVYPRSSGPKSAVWRVDPHTLAKHEILRRYVDAWFPIMSKWNPRLIFFDGFAGPGIYQSGEPGSPLIVLRRLIEHSAFARFSIGTEYVFLFCEPDRERLASLEQHLEDYKQSLGGQWPASIKVMTRGQPFDATAGEILEDLERAGSRLAPTFAFVDPFGISGLPMNLLARLTASPKCELFVNMIMNTAKRFASSGQIDTSLADLYGTSLFTQAEGLTGRPRIEFLHDLYAQQLKGQCGFSYIQSFEMVNKHGHTSYYLFYATRNLAGLSSMKAAMWKADPGGGYRFSDQLAGQDVLFIEDELDPMPLRSQLLQVFHGCTISVEALEHYVLVNTPYRETHLRKHALAPLEKEGVIGVARPGQRQYPKGTLISFP